jgi:hypothetical protein
MFLMKLMSLSLIFFFLSLSFFFSLQCCFIWASYK